MTVINFLPLDLGSALLGGFFQALFDRLMPHSLPHIIVTDKEVRSEVNKWFTKLAIIQAALDDAEEKQWTNMAVKMWLNDLRDFAYDLEDMLDEHNTAILKRSLKAEAQRDLISMTVEELKILWENFNKMSNSRGMTHRLEELCERRSLLGLIERTAGGTSTPGWQRPPSTCLPTEPAICGRDEDKRKVLEMMSRNEPSAATFRVISIVGMAGVGKTTLAKEVYNDSGVEFDPKVWICVSNSFDVFRMSKSILESITHSTCDLKDLNEVQVQLKLAVAGKRFLLVLDDVWSKNYDLWETFKSPFVTAAQGSRIIVTTPCMDVASTMGGPSDYYNLKLLSDDDCWYVFQKHAFGSGNINVYPNLESVRKKVVQKCGGLPLAARTLGGLLRSKQRDDEWEDILNSQIWDLPEDSNILPVLKLNYYHLPSHLKRCLAYCATLPTNYEFEEKELILLWIAEGLILPSANNKPLEEIAGEYFRNLLSRSIFQQSSGNASKFVMHNLFNDLAQWISSETIFRLENELVVKKNFKRLQRARHSSYAVSEYDGKNKFKVFDEVNHDHLRTFLPVLTHNLDCYISNAVLFDLLPKFKKLRVLSLRKYHITELPDSIGKLRYLRYLNLADTDIASLPESIMDLINLQIMILRNCSRLSKLPCTVEKLIHLRHLDIEGVKSIREMPAGMQELRYLETLSNFIVGKNTGSCLKELNHLKFLRGELHISQLENVTDSEALGGAILSDKKYLQMLILEWGLNNSGNEEDEKDVLDMLRPHTNLKKLTINHYGGSTFPSWIEDPSFSNMVTLRLEGCVNCTSLPSLGILAKLRELTISRMTELKTIDSGFYGSHSKPFQSLEILCFEDLQEWSLWDPIGDNVHDEVLGCLRELSIVNCPKLSERFPAHLPSLQKLVIQKCAKLVVSISSVPTLSKLDIDDSLSLNSMSHLNISEFGTRFNQACSVRNPETPFLSSLSVLEVKDCNALTSLQGIMNHSASLGHLVIKGCDSLTSIANGQLLLSLRRLEISSCEKLQCLLDGPSPMQESTSNVNTSLLEYLCVSKCPSLESLSSTGQVSDALQLLEIQHCSKLTTLCQLPETLKHLEIKTCRKLNSLSSTGQLPASLEHLSIYDSLIKTLSSTGHLPASLQHLNIEFCSRLTCLSSGHLPVPLKYLKINSCESLISIADSLQNLSSLSEIDLFYCPSLVSFPREGLLNCNLAILSIRYCDKLVELPDSMHTLKSLKEFHILNNFNLTSLSSFPQYGFPINLTSLSVSIPHFYDQVMKRLHKLTSLRNLHISGCQDAKSFPQEMKKKVVLPTSLSSRDAKFVHKKKKAILLPTSLTSLTLENFGKLESLSPKGFTNITSLECLSISKCSALTSFPKKGLLSSLLELHISDCSKLKDYCLRDIRGEQSEIANIPYVKIDGKFIHEPKPTIVNSLR